MRITGFRGIVSLAVVVLTIGSGATARGRDVALAGDPPPKNAIPFPLTGRQTVRAGANSYYIDGAQVIPAGAAIRVEKQVNIIGINQASLDVRGELAVHGTMDCWVHIRDVDFSPTVNPEGGLHLDMASLHNCKFKHAEGASYSGGITMENSALQYDCE